MDERDKILLREVREIAEENRRMLKKLYRSWWWGRVGKAIYWIVIIGITFGAFYFIQPYIERIQTIFSSAEKQVNTVQSVKDIMTGGNP